MSPFNIHCYLCFTIIFAVYSTWKSRCSTTSGILYMPTTLSLLENVRECLKYLYMLTIHLLGNSNNFCSIICEMHLIDVSNFLRSRISLTPPAPGRLRNTRSTSHLEWPHVIRAKRCCRRAVPGAPPMELAFYNRTALWNSLWDTTTWSKPFSGESSSVCLANQMHPSDFNPKVLGSCHHRDGALQKQPFLSLLPICIAIYRLGYCNTGHLSALSFWDIGEIGKIHLFFSGGAEHEGFSSLFIDWWMDICSSERFSRFIGNLKRIWHPLLVIFKH